MRGEHQNFSNKCKQIVIVTMPNERTHLATKWCFCRWGLSKRVDRKSGFHRRLSRCELWLRQSRGVRKPAKGEKENQLLCGKGNHRPSSSSSSPTTTTTTRGRDRAYLELGHFVEPLVVDDGTDHDDDALFVGHFGHVLGDGAHRQRRTVDAGHEQPFQHDLVEMGTGAPSQVPVQLQVSAHTFV